jgi:DNA-binding GntR family transcriptional regulator
MSFPTTFSAPSTTALSTGPRGDGCVPAIEGMRARLAETRATEDRIRQLEAEVVQLRAAMDSRAPIEQAKGILMLLTGCGDQVAFDLLAHISSHTHRKVRDVAVAIAASAAGRSPLPADVRTIVQEACPPPRARA